jgi:Flp pilus assembly protein TadG
MRAGWLAGPDRDPTRSRDAGQASVELALALPVLALLLLVAVQVGLVVRAQVLVTHAAREAARAAAVDPDPSAALDAARASADLDPTRLTVLVSGRGPPGSRVEVDVRYRVATDVPLAGTLLGEVEVSARATMRVE